MITSNKKTFVDVTAIIVGNDGVGKTTLRRYMRYDYVITEHDSLYEEDYAVPKLQEGIYYRINFIDTVDYPGYDRLRILNYSCNPFIFIICYSVNSRTSFEAISQKWIPEILKYSPKSHYILCGTKIDLRNAKSTTDLERKYNFIKFKEAKKLANTISAASVVECSSYHNCVEHVRDEIIAIVKFMDPKRKIYVNYKRKKSECILQ